MNEQRTNHLELTPSMARKGIRAMFFALVFMLTHVAQAVPITADVYGAPYFSIPGWGNQAKPNSQWITLERNQGLNMVLENDQISMVGRHDLSTHDRSGQHDQFSFLSMQINLPESDKNSHGFVDYLMGDQIGQFSLEHVVYRTPPGVNDALLSLFFWGIDYANGAGLVLGLEAVSPISDSNVTAQVDEPSIVLLMLMGFGAYRLSRVSARAGV